MKINPVPTGIPSEMGTSFMVRIMPFDTTAKTCSLYWEVYSNSLATLANGNIALTEEEFDGWGFDNTYIENIALERLGLVRIEEDEEIPTPSE